MSWGACERALNLTRLGKASRGKPRRKPESGNPTFRDCRGARANVTLLTRTGARSSALSRPRPVLREAGGAIRPAYSTGFAKSAARLVTAQPNAIARSEAIMRDRRIPHMSELPFKYETLDNTDTVRGVPRTVRWDKISLLRRKVSYPVQSGQFRGS
jgi:hypothetical protein